MTDEQFKKNYEGMIQAVGFLKEYEPIIKKTEMSNGLEKILKEETGQEINFSQLTDEQKANFAKGLPEIYQTRVIKYVKSNLDSIVKSTEPEKLINIVTGIKNKTENYKEFTNLLQNYDNYRELVGISEKISKGYEPKTEEEEKIIEEYQEKSAKLLPDIIKAKIVEKIQDKDEQEKWTKLIVSILNIGYIHKVFNEETMKLQKELITRMSDKKETINYLTDNLKEDQDYMNFAGRLYQLQGKKED